MTGRAPLPPSFQSALRRLRKLGFVNYAAQYAEAAGLAAHRAGFFSPVPYMLYCRAIELSLKAYLLHSGVPVADLARPPLRHNLVRILARADELGLGKLLRLNRRQRAEIQRAHAYYDRKGFEYFDPLKEVAGRRHLPQLPILAETVRLLLQQLRRELAVR